MSDYRGGSTNNGALPISMEEPAIIVLTVAQTIRN